MNKSNKIEYIIKDDFGNQLYGKVFTDFDDAWSFIYCKYPVIYDKDGKSIDDQEEELDSHWVVQKTINK